MMRTLRVVLFILLAPLTAVAQPFIPDYEENYVSKNNKADLALATAAANRLGLNCEGQGIYGVEHARWHKLYKKMHNQLGHHCCGDGDCRPSKAVFDSQSDRWLTCVNELPRFIEKDRHVKDAYGLTGFASVCVNKNNDQFLYCFVKPYESG